LLLFILAEPFLLVDSNLHQSFSGGIISDFFLSAVVLVAAKRSDGGLGRRHRRPSPQSMPLVCCSISDSISFETDPPFWSFSKHIAKIRALVEGFSRFPCREGWFMYPERGRGDKTWACHDSPKESSPRLETAGRWNNRNRLKIKCYRYEHTRKEQALQILGKIISIYAH
jgi:hypothetical protein